MAEIANVITGLATIPATVIENSTPAKSPPKTAKPTKSTKPTNAYKAPAIPANPAVGSKETAPAKPAPIAKSGKVETTLTPTEKAKREKLLLAVTESVRKETSAIANGYMRIGFQLWNVREKKLYLAADMKNVYEYSETAFGFRKSSAINFIAVCEKFSCKDKDGKPTDKIDPAFALYGYTQLSEMLPLSDETLVNVKPEMSMRDIRALKTVQSTGQSDKETPDTDTAKDMCRLYYSGSVNVETWDRLLEKLEKLIPDNKRIEITIIG